VPGEICQTSQLSPFITGPGDMLEGTVKVQLVEYYRTASQFHCDNTPDIFHVYYGIPDLVVNDGKELVKSFAVLK
jgi:hypothetical protein